MQRKQALVFYTEAKKGCYYRKTGMVGLILKPFPPIHTSKGPDFLLSDILAPTYEMLQIDQEVGSCVRPELGNHSRKLDKIQEWNFAM